MPTIDVNEEAAKAADDIVRHFAEAHPMFGNDHLRADLKTIARAAVKETIRRALAAPVIVAVQPLRRDAVGRIESALDGKARLAVDAVEYIKPATIVDVEVGDVVRLRSGGPLMSVGQIFQASETARQLGQRADAAHCFWHDEGLAAQSGTFPLPSLVREVEGYPALVACAMALWGPIPLLDAAVAGGWDHPFDYLQSLPNERRITDFARALAGIDGVARSFHPQERR